MTGWLARLRSRRGAAEMSFFEHLDELRGVLLSSIAVLLVLAVVAWFFSARLIDLLVVRTVGQAQFIRPLEAFSTRVKISLLLGLIAGMPFIAFRIWGFIVPGLLHRERRFLMPIVLWSTLLFLLGVGFSTFVLSPMMLKLLLTFQTKYVTANVAVGYLLDFVLKMAFACGLLFQLPLIVAMLSHAGIVTPGYLKSKWRHAVVVILIVAAVVTPGDGPSQLVLAVPIVLLYFVSILVSASIHRGKRRRAAERDADLEPSGGAQPEGAEGAPRDPEKRDWSI